MLLSIQFSRSGGTGRRSRLKICRGSLPVWVRLPPPGPSFQAHTKRARISPGPGCSSFVDYFARGDPFYVRCDPERAEPVRVGHSGRATTKKRIRSCSSVGSPRPQGRLYRNRFTQDSVPLSSCLNLHLPLPRWPAVGRPDWQGRPMKACIL